MGDQEYYLFPEPEQVARANQQELAALQRHTALCRENWFPKSLRESKNCQNIDRVLGKQS